MPKLALDVKIFMQQTTSADDIFRCILCSRLRVSGRYKKFPYLMRRFMFERIHNTKERKTTRQKSGCLNTSNERIFQVNIQMQGQIKDS